MFDKLEALEERYEVVNQKLSDPDIVSNQEEFRKYCKENSDLTPIIDKYREYKALKATITECKEILSSGDKELEELAKMELSEAEDNIESVSDELKILLLPKDPNDDKNVIIEIRGGTGGEEAALFAADLFRMYNLNLNMNQVFTVSNVFRKQNHKAEYRLPQQQLLFFRKLKKLKLI